MNEWDNDNLVWMLTCTEQEWTEWVDQATNEEIAYALELMGARRVVIALHEAQVLDNVVDLQQANRVLEKFRLKKG